ncbi:unnamed protein product [Moneuplotes crassus]|uniref:Uncharacterized protein n=1 Tax=Euplotes crassus TaxID=5936 RepID=A0AAD1UAV0_EUPCR|nr:unnamed protein product [Moneuplotes crassus]
MGSLFSSPSHSQYKPPSKNLDCGQLKAVAMAEANKFKDTHYMKSFSNTERYPPIKEALNDLKSIFKGSYIDKMYKEHKQSTAKVVISIWTKEVELTKLINAALIVDSVETFNKDVSTASVKYMKKVVAESGKTYQQIIDKSIKFMRLLNSYIVDEGRDFNTENRVVYRGVNKEIFCNVECGKLIRIVNWSCCSEDLHIAKNFTRFQSSEDENINTIVRFNIKSGCYNAGKLNEIGVSCYVQEKETLIPPYTVCVIKKKTKLTNEALRSIISDTCSHSGFSFFTSSGKDDDTAFSECFERERTNSDTEITHLFEVDISINSKSSILDNANACYF